MREAYWRAEHEDAGFTVTVGLAVRDEDTDSVSILSDLRNAVALAANQCWSRHQDAVRHVEEQLEQLYPDRPYFIETDRAGKGVQVYDPRDFVKERCSCPCIQSKPAVSADPEGDYLEYAERQACAGLEKFCDPDALGEDKDDDLPF